jgi:predicted DNA-binding WGR domain protein
MNMHYFEFSDGTSNKFWEITVTGAQHTVRYGKSGTDGQTRVKEFVDCAAAEKSAQKLIAEKMGKGYQEIVTAAVVIDPNKLTPLKSEAKSAPNDSNVVTDEDGITEQRQKLEVLRERILVKAEKLKKKLGGSQDQYSDYNLIRKSVHFADLTYRLIGNPVTVKGLNRLTSLAHGPLYCSRKFPRPVDRRGEPMFPVFQIDTEQINRWCRRQLARGLVQVWAYDHLRFIPANEVSAELMTPDDMSPLDYNDGIGIMVPGNWVPDDTKCMQITGAVLVGYSCPEILRRISCRDVLEEEQEEFVADLSDIESNWEWPEVEIIEGFRLFGDFSPIQLIPTDFYPYRLLLEHNWGAEGLGQVFYDDANGETNNFTYSSCGR